MIGQELENEILRVLGEKGPLDQRFLHCEIFGYRDDERGRTLDVIDAEMPGTLSVLEGMLKRKVLARKETRFGRRTGTFTYRIATPKRPRAPLTEEQRQLKAEARAAGGIYNNLPKIVVVLGVTDHGPCDMGATAICPHCGAEGRYVYRFMCDDGTTRGAMRGCISKYPRHPFAEESRRILDKEQDYKLKGWQLPSWDREIKEAIFAFAEGDISEQEAEGRVRRAQEARRRHRARRR